MATLELKQKGKTVKVIIPDDTSGVLYMHTLENLPAFFDGDQIVYARKEINLSQMESSLSEIRKQQRKSGKFRRTVAKDTGFLAYSHVRIKLS